MKFFGKYLLFFLEDHIYFFYIFIFKNNHYIDIASMHVIFNCGTKKHNNSVFFEEFFKFLFPAFEFVGFIRKKERDKMRNVIIIKIKLVGYGFSDGFAYDYIFLKKPLKDFLGSDMAYIEDFANRISIIECSIIFEQDKYSFSFFLG